MLYAASSRRSSVRLQRQASLSNSLRPTSASSSRPSSASSFGRPNTASSFQTDKRPTTPYKKSTISESIQHIKSTFMLSDQDLDQFHRAFCYMAKKDVISSSVLSATPKREKEKEKTVTSKTTSDAPIPTGIQILEHPWEEEKISKIRLSISDFFGTFQRSNNGGFLDGIFDLVGTNDLHAMSYNEFLDGVCTFGMFKLDDMIKLIFFILDKGKEGEIRRFQLLRFVEAIHGKKIIVFEQVILPDKCKKAPSLRPKGLENLRLPAAERQKASVDYAALKNLCIAYPNMLEPMLLFQNTIRRRIMGEVWWTKKENQIEKYFRTLGHVREKKRRREEKRLLKERKQKMQSDIGLVAYYSRSNARSEIEKEYPKPVVSLEDETGEICVEWTRTDGGDDDVKGAEIE